jgi:hypothetical protein
MLQSALAGVPGLGVTDVPAAGALGVGGTPPPPPTTVTCPAQCSRNWSSQFEIVLSGQTMSVARLLTFSRHARVYTSAAASDSRLSLACSFAVK